MATLAAAVVLFFLRGLTVLLVIILCGKVFWNWPLNMRHVILSRVQVFIQPYPCSFSISPPSRPGPKWCGRWNMPRMLHKHLPSLPGRKKKHEISNKKGCQKFSNLVLVCSFQNGGPWRHRHLEPNLFEPPEQGNRSRCEWWHFC